MHTGLFIVCFRVLHNLVSGRRLFPKNELSGGGGLEWPFEMIILSCYCSVTSEGVDGCWWHFVLKLCPWVPPHGRTNMKGSKVGEAKTTLPPPPPPVDSDNSWISTPRMSTWPNRPGTLFGLTVRNTGGTKCIKVTCRNYGLRNSVYTLAYSIRPLSKVAFKRKLRKLNVCMVIFI
jgi:hypothetical protein